MRPTNLLSERCYRILSLTVAAAATSMLVTAVPSHSSANEAVDATGVAADAAQTLLLTSPTAQSALVTVVSDGVETLSMMLPAVITITPQLRQVFATANIDDTLRCERTGRDPETATALGSVECPIGIARDDTSATKE